MAAVLRGLSLFSLLAAGVWVGCGGDAFDSTPGSGASAGQGGTGGSQGGSGGTGGGSSGSSGNGGSGGNADWFACGGPGECQAVANTCCGACGRPSASDLAGVHQDHVEDYRGSLCTEPIGCPDCAVEPNPWLYAYCQGSGTCAVDDLSRSSLNSCTDDSQCVLRTPGCCESCNAQPHELIAMNRDNLGDYLTLICDGAIGCPACEPIYPEGYEAGCSAEGYCEVRDGGPVDRVCPANQPNPGDSCSTQGMRCEYGDDPRVDCRTHANCGMGQWLVEEVSCEAIPDPGTNGCPVSRPNNAVVCANNGLVCAYDGGDACVCTNCGGGPCGGDAKWSCSAPPMDCPYSPPPLGHPCDNQGQSCSYGNCTHPLSVGRRCEQGVWVDFGINCPA